MTWTVNSILLPFGGPQTEKRGVLRRQTANKIIEQFPFPVDIGPQSYELTITGLIHAIGHAGSNADQLWEDLKNAEKPTVQLVVTEPEFAKYSGLYAVNKMDIGMSKPMFDATSGEMVKEYNITFVQFAEDIGELDTGDNSLDEPGIGFGDINITFGDMIFDSFQNIFPNMLS